MARFRNGRKDYSIGNHPVWESFRAIYQMTKSPFVIGGLMVLSGYVWASIRRAERPVSPDLVTFVRREQMQRLKRFFRSHRIPRVPADKTVQDPHRCT